MSELPDMKETPSEELQIISEAINEVPQTSEAGPEAVPTKKEVLASIVEFIRYLSAREGRTINEDVKILVETWADEGYLYHVQADVEDPLNDEIMHFTYTKGGSHPDGVTRLFTGIDVFIDDTRGIPCGGYSVAELIEGVLTLTCK